MRQERSDLYELRTTNTCDMNYLAHLFLAENTPESRIGNLLGDFVKGSIDSYENIYSPSILQGIINHRKIDFFTDHHPIFLQSKRRISKEKGRFSGIRIDIFYDHFLANNWNLFAEEDLEIFVQKMYNILNDNINILPRRLQQMLPFMIKENWLYSYKDLEGITLTCQRLSRRFKRVNPLAKASEELILNYNELQQDFLVFLPELLNYVQNFKNI